MRAVAACLGSVSCEVGDTGVATIALAVANALFAVTGELVRSLPLANAGFII